MWVLMPVMPWELSPLAFLRQSNCKENILLQARNCHLFHQASGAILASSFFSLSHLLIVHMRFLWEEERLKPVSMMTPHVTSWKDVMNHLIGKDVQVLWGGLKCSWKIELEDNAEASAAADCVKLLLKHWPPILEHLLLCFNPAHLNTICLS